MSTSTGVQLAYPFYISVCHHPSQNREQLVMTPYITDGGGIRGLSILMLQRILVNALIEVWDRLAEQIFSKMLFPKLEKGRYMASRLEDAVLQVIRTVNPPELPLFDAPYVAPPKVVCCI